MVVRSAQKGRDDIQRIRDAMEGRKTVITDSQRELIIKQANIIGEDGVAIVEDIEDAAVSTTSKLLPADIFRMIESCMASLSQKVKIQMQSGRDNKRERAGKTEADRGHKGAGNNAPRKPAQQGQAHRGECCKDDERCRD
jgi:hypothetical protein